MSRRAALDTLEIGALLFLLAVVGDVLQERSEARERLLPPLSTAIANRKRAMRCYECETPLIGPICPACNPQHLDHAIKPLDQHCAARGHRISELEEALRDCIAFVAVHADKYRRDFGLDEIHPTHAAILDRASVLTGGAALSAKLKATPRTDNGT